MTIFALACMFVIGVLTGVIGTVALCVHLDNKLALRHPDATVVHRFPEFSKHLPI